jgi:hypothetical protein
MCFEAACGWGHGRTLLDQDSLAYLRELSGSQRVRVSLVMAVLEVKRGGADEMNIRWLSWAKRKG